MARRSESLLVVLALLVLLPGLMLLDGCRAFDPEPVIVNRPPDTFITGAPAETTGTRFLRHMYWYGTDVDGEVVRFIWALTDSTVRDESRPEEDEENDRFNPALDITTIENIPGRQVGFTTQTDSTFLFAVNRVSTPSKDVTFHLVAVDDRGALDPTPARLHFINNSLGNPSLRFLVHTFEDTGSSDPWVLRWVGTPDGPELGATCEDSPTPFIGFQQRFRVTWEASSPNGPIVGYRFNASQDPKVPYTPSVDSPCCDPCCLGNEGTDLDCPDDLDGDGVPDQCDLDQDFDDDGYPDGCQERPSSRLPNLDRLWCSQVTSFIFENDQPPETLDGCDPRSLEGCPPAKVRFPSGSYRLRVSALDVAQVESEAREGELEFEVNYPPETEIVRDAEYPQWTLDDGSGAPEPHAFSEGDTIPDGATVLFLSAGFDRLPSSLPVPNPDGGDDYGCFCCDVVDDPTADEVKFQGQVKLVGDEGFRQRRFDSLFSRPVPQDTISFAVGPFAYTFLSRTEDEHQRKDRTPDEFRFVAGFRPKVVEISPADGDSLILRNPLLGEFWPENDVPYEIPTSTVAKYWDGIQYLDTDGPGRTRIDCHVFKLRPRLIGAADSREPHNSVQAWAYSLASENDPANLFVDGCCESSDLSFYAESPLDNEWAFDDEDAIEILVPSLLWQVPDFFDYQFPGNNPIFVQAALGYHVKQLGDMTFQVQGRTTSATTPDFQLPVEVRPGGASTPIDVERIGRRTDVSEVRFHVYLGIGATSIERLWPDEKTFPPAEPGEAR